MLKIQNLTKSFNGFVATNGVDLTIAESERHAIIGPNGAGKSTLFNLITGHLRPDSGTVIYRGEEITGMKPHTIVRKEVSRSFQHTNVYPKLKELRGRRGGYLSGGEQQMLTIGRSLLTNPDLLLLDEPSEGLAPLIVEAMREQIGALRKEGLSVLLAEQSLDFVLSLSDRLYILEKGEVKFTGTPADVRANEGELQKYLTVQAFIYLC